MFSNIGGKIKGLAKFFCWLGIIASVIAGVGMMILGDQGGTMVRSADSYYSFKKQMDVFVNWLRTGKEPFPFSETVELMKLVIGGLRSREEGGREVFLDEILAD